MSRYGSPSWSVFRADGYNLLGNNPKAVSCKNQSVMERVDGLGDSNFKNLPVGVTIATLEQSGALFDDTTNYMHTAMASPALVQTVRIVTLAITGNTIGKAGFGAEGTYASTYEVLGQNAGLTKANAIYTLTGKGDFGIILNQSVAKTADWNTKTDGASVDNGASSAFGGAGYQQVYDMSGFTGFVGKIRDSADDSSYADLITFTNVTAGPIAERKTLATTVGRYLSYNGDVTGSGSITAFVLFARWTS